MEIWKRSIPVFAIVPALSLIACSGGGGSSASSTTLPSTAQPNVSFTSSSTAWIGWCKKVRVGFTDTSGTAQTLAASIAFSVTGNSALTFSDAACSNSITSITASAGVSGVDIYIKPTAASIAMGFSLNSTELGAKTYAAESALATNTGTIYGQSSSSSATANSSGANAGGLSDPRRLVVAGSRVLIADRANHRVVIYPTLTATNPTAVLGQPDLNTLTSNPTPSGGLFSDPVSVWSDGTRIVVTSRSQNRVMIWNNFPVSDGAAPDIFVGQTNDTGTSSGTGLDQLSNPEHAFITGTKLVVVDGGNNRILIFNTVPASSGTAANISIGVGSGNASDSFNGPTFATMISTALYVADSGNNRIQVFNSLPTVSGASADVSLSVGNASANPTNIAVIGSKFLVYDEDKSRIVFWNKTPTASTAPDGVLGQPDLTSVDTTIDGKTFGRGYGLTIVNDQIWVVDSERNRVLKYTPPSL